MKKLMIALTAVAMAAGVQAAMVDWSYTDYTELGDYVGAKVYAIVGTMQTTWKTVDEVKAAQMTIGGSGTVIQDGPFLSTGDVSSGSTSLQTKDKGGNYYLVVVSADEKKYGVYAGDTDYIYGDLDPSPGSFEFSTDEVVPTTAFTGGDVPEPTSAMLMLLGVAGLALKRKRA